MPWLEIKGMSLSGNSIGRESGTLTRKRETLNARLELEVSAGLGVRLDPTPQP